MNLYKNLFLKIMIGILVLSTTGLTLPADVSAGKIIKEIRITGLIHTKKYIISRELASKTGQPFRRENLEKDRKRLVGLGIFSNVTVDALEQEDGIVLTIKVREISPYLPIASFKIDDENGFALKAGIKSLNLFGRGIFFSASAAFGEASTYVFKIRNPWFAGKRMSYKIDIFHRIRDNELDDFKEVGYELFSTLASLVGKRTRMGVRFSFQYIQSDTPGKTLSADNTDNAVSLGYFIGFDSLDLKWDPHRGWWNEIEIIRSGLFGLLDSNFWRLNLDLRRYIPVAPRHTLALFSLTTLTSGTVGKEIAPWQDFSIGGTNSVRGWELGSKTGKNQFLNTVEYRYSLMKPKGFSFLGFRLPIGLQIAVFADLGSAWNRKDEFNKNLIAGFGLGLRFISPTTGMARVDFGFGQGGFSVRIHLGSYEKPVKQRDRVR